LLLQPSKTFGFLGGARKPNVLEGWRRKKTKCV
jgi:hypothetical protein